MEELLGIGRTAQIYSADGGAVLKLFFGWVPEHLVDAEESAIVAAFAAGAPAPRLLGRVEQSGRMGLVLERVSGPSMLSELMTHPWQVLPLAERLARLQVAIQACSAEGLPVLRERLRSRIRSATGLPAQARNWALARLETLPDGDHLLHGDLHPGNIILTSKGPIAIDWMTASHGDRAADAARTALILELASPQLSLPAVRRGLTAVGRRAFRKRWLMVYTRASTVRPTDIMAWMPVVAAARVSDNIPEEQRRLCAIVDAASGIG